MPALMDAKQSSSGTGVGFHLANSLSSLYLYHYVKLRRTSSSSDRAEETNFFRREATAWNERLTAVFPITISEAAPPSFVVLLAILLSSMNRIMNVGYYREI
jgi:hypothetical protein